MKLLIADDDVTSRLVLAGVLRKHGHEVEVTEDGTEAWEAMQRADAPQIAILDWMMPGLAGVEVCRLVRTLPSDQPPYLILLTSRGEKSDIVAGLEAGADDYLAKPFDPGELRARVDVGRRMVELQARLAEAYAAMALRADHDSLTGALNRRAFAEVLARALADERRHHDGLALGVFDVDEFKRINDQHGHPVGDEALCGLVRVVTEALREGDVLGRLGGDEFLALATHTGAAGGDAIFERIRAVVAGTSIKTAAGDLSITASFGVSRWTEGVTVDGLIAAADAALYRAKSEGRNRVSLAPDPAGS